MTAIKKRLIIPTSINMLTMANDAILASYRDGFDAEIVLPSLRKRAKMIVGETGLLPVEEQEIEEPIATFTR